MDHAVSYTFGPFTLDESALELRRGEAPVELRRQAYDTLAYLLRNRDRVITKRELFDAIWQGRTVTENTLSQSISDIRRALGRDARSYIKTVHGRGFRFEGKIECTIPSSPETWGEDATGAAQRAPVEALSRALAVLPFESAAGDPQEIRFGQGLSEDLVRCLSMWNLFPVIAAGSTWNYAGPEPLDPYRAATQLGAPYVVHGSIDTGGGRVRVRVRLNEATTRTVLWSEHYDDQIEGFFALQDEMAEKIAAQLFPELVRAHVSRLERNGPPVLDAWQAAVLGLGRFLRDCVDDATAAHFERAQKIDEHFVLPIFYLGYLHHLRVYYQHTNDVEGSFARVRHAAERCLELAPGDPSGHLLNGLVKMVAGEPEAALHSMELAVERNPSLADARQLLGQLLAMRGRGEEGTRQARLALRLSPRDPRRNAFLSSLAMGHFVAGRYEDASRCAEHASRERPELIPNYLCIASCAGLLRDEERARNAVATLRRLGPAYSARTLDRLLATTLPEIRERFWEGVHTAGFERP